MRRRSRRSAGEPHVAVATGAFCKYARLASGCRALCPAGCDGARRSAPPRACACGALMPSRRFAAGSTAETRGLAGGGSSPEVRIEALRQRGGVRCVAAASDEGVAVDAKQAAARAEANDCGGLVSARRFRSAVGQAGGAVLA